MKSIYQQLEMSLRGSDGSHLQSLTAVDLFAGAGGFSEGASIAGVRSVWAGNHDMAAVEAHSSNFPFATHVCQDLNQADWSKLPAHDLMLASPACQGHSRARGKEKPHHDAQRSTAWAVIAAVEALRPKRLLLENVKEFATWDLFEIWSAALRKLGYDISVNVLNAADFGVPQSRERIFIVGALGEAACTIKAPMLPHAPASSIIDHSIKGFTPVRKAGRAVSTLKQWDAGREKYGEEFILAYYGSEKCGRSLHKPLGTVTTKERFALVRGDEMRMLGVSEYKAAMGFRADYCLPGNKKHAIRMLGNAVPPPMAAYAISEVVRGLKAS